MSVLPLDELTAVSPIDGRYGSKTAPLREYFSEYALIRERVRVEIAWFLQLADCDALDALPAPEALEREQLETIASAFGLSDAAEIKALERTTNHDVKAVEYFLKQRLEPSARLATYREFIHFACTSEDINNLAYARLLARYRESLLLPALDALIDTLAGFAHAQADVPLLSRTHGQTASPSTLGKEFANVVHRLRRHRKAIARVALLGKINGATGNYNAHVAAWPDFDWPRFCSAFVESLGLEFNTHTTQIEPHDFIAEQFDALARCNVTMIDLTRDIWGYISLGYLTQKPIAGEIGSSTMPHKVNPIDFENAEGNLGLANAVFDHVSRKLPISRWQRDLTDSTVLRNLGVGAGYTHIAFASLQKGLGKLGVNRDALERDLDAAWEVIAEPVQTVMRRYGLSDAYERLKALTRGRSIDQASIAGFIDSLELPAEERRRLKALTPASYTGLAAELARDA